MAYVLALLREAKKDMAHIKTAWIIIHAIFIPMTILDIFTELPQPYETIVTALVILYLTISVGRGAVRLFNEVIAAREKYIEYKKKRDAYLKRHH